MPSTAESAKPARTLLWANLARAGIISVRPAMDGKKANVTALLERVSDGDLEAEEQLLPEVYLQLHTLALSQLRKERIGHTLQATALVHEAFLKLCREDQVSWKGRGHFFGIAARMMRRILIDYARKRNAAKRGDGRAPLSLDEALVIDEHCLADAIEIDDLLNQLAALNPRQAKVVEMRFFAGLGEEEIASILSVNVRTVKRDWFMARAWFHTHLRG